MSRFLFKLYVAGDTLRSQQAAANLRRLGDEWLGGDYELTVIDVALALPTERRGEQR